MKDPNEPSASIHEPVPLSMKLALLGGGILIIAMLALIMRSIFNIFQPSSPPSDTALQVNADTAQPKLPAETLPASAPENPETPSVNRPSSFTVQIEIAEQRRKARAETIEALKREALEQAGTSGVPKEVLQKIEQSDPIIY